MEVEVSLAPISEVEHKSGTKRKRRRPRATKMIDLMRQVGFYKDPD